MNRKIYLSGLLLLNLCICAAVAYFAFSGKDFSADQMEKSVRLGACYRDLNNSYYSVLNNEISSVVEGNGDILLARDSEMDQEKQNEQIRRLLDQDIRGLFINPVDSEGVLPALEEARKRGVFVVAVDTGVSDESAVDCVVMTDRYSGGEQLANYLMAQSDSARVALLVQNGVLAAEQCVQGFEDALEKNGNFSVAAREECAGQIEQGMEAMKAIVDSGCAFDAVFAVNDPAALGALAELDRDGIGGIKWVVGVDGSPAGKAMVKSRKLAVTMAQYPEEMGSRAAECMYRLISGGSVEDEVLLPVKLITKNTIDAYDIDKW